MADKPSTLDDDQPPYLHIADVLRGEIVDGRYPVGGRLPAQAELEERFEVSRPTVQRALNELRRDGLIDNQRGRAAKVLPWQEQKAAGSSLAPGGAFPVLTTHVAEAFTHQDITIDTFSLTTETLNAVLNGPLMRVKLGELQPASIRVRVLLPTLDARLALPRFAAEESAAGPEGEQPLRRLRRMMNGHVIALQSAFTGLDDTGVGVSHSLEFRCVPITPLFKLYVLNRGTALHGLYRVVRRTVQLDGGEGEIYDVLGVSAKLFPYRADADDPDGPQSLFVEESRSWFESLWSTIAEPMSLLE